MVLGPDLRLLGITLGNDMSSRDIEGENPLYLPQAKVFRACAAVGPGILIAEQPIGKDTAVRGEIVRGGATVFSGDTTLAQLKRTPEELAGWLFKEESFPTGCYMMTGTGIVPPDDFTLQGGDEVRITIDGIGTLVNGMD
ncbi:MAG: fumarylacetoacetate hydrolase family protein [Roseimicrobium sp.]